MGEVYLAEDTQLGRKVALKLLAEELTQNRDRLNRFRSGSLRRVGLQPSEHSLRFTKWVTKAVVTSSRRNLSTGETLRHRLGGPPMDLPEVLNVGIQIAEALEEAHAAGHYSSRH
jgi:serine/threonine-protein kinase